MTPEQLKQNDAVKEAFAGIITKDTFKAQEAGLNGLSQQPESKPEKKEIGNSSIKFDLGFDGHSVEAADTLIINTPQLDAGGGEVKVKVKPVGGTRRGGEARVSGNVRPELLEFLKEGGKFDVKNTTDVAAKTITLQTGKLSNKEALIVKGETVPLNVEYTLYVPESLLGTLKNADGTPFKNYDGSYYEKENGRFVEKFHKAQEDTNDTVSNSAKGSSETFKNTAIINRINNALSPTVRDIPDNYGAYMKLVDDVKADTSLTDEGRKAALKALAEKYPKGETEYKFREYKRNEKK